MADSARCSSCDLNLPSDKKSCLVCGGSVWLDKGTPHDPNWADQAAQLLRRHVPGDPIPVAAVSVVEKDGRYFVAEELLEQYGYHDLKADDVVLIYDVYYELEGRLAGETPAWWIALIETEVSADSITPEAIIG